jgi:hypothetical protein
LAAYRFLETLKWEQGFHCGKCGNPKYFEGAQKFARRCTKCGYNESITAFTIFQGIKFPLEKAFYIAYLCVVGKKEGTLESFAKQLEIGLNTVWAFRTKVMTRLKELEDSGRRLSASKWEEVILYPESLPKVKPKKTKSLA